MLFLASDTLLARERFVGAPAPRAAGGDRDLPPRAAAHRHRAGRRGLSCPRLPRRPSRTAPIVIIPGWQGSGPGHWQTWLEDELRASGRDTRRPEFADLDQPDLADWLAALRATVAGLPAGRLRRRRALARGRCSGCTTWPTRRLAPAARVLLVAPPSPDTEIAEIAGFFPPPMDVDTVRRGADGTVLVAGDDDPYLPEGIASAYGRAAEDRYDGDPGGRAPEHRRGLRRMAGGARLVGRDNLAFF